MQALYISPLAGEQRAASAGGAIGSPGGAARRPRRPGDAVAYAVGERLAERVGVADARRGVAPADDLVADAGDVASSSSRSSPGSEMMASSRGGSADGDGASEPRFRRSGALARTPIVFSEYTASPAHELV